jgi:hypothetical protein
MRFEGDNRDADAGGDINFSLDAFALIPVGEGKNPHLASDAKHSNVVGFPSFPGARNFHMASDMVVVDDRGIDGYPLRDVMGHRLESPFIPLLFNGGVRMRVWTG